MRWLRRAADLAVVRYEIDRALALLHEALALEPDDRTRTEIWLASAAACKFSYDTDGFRGALERALALEPPPALSADIHAELAHAGGQPVAVARPAAGGAGQALDRARAGPGRTGPPPWRGP